MNGDKPSSHFLNHLSSYPVVSDGIEAYKTNPYGKKSLELADNAYNRFGKPVQPYLETPYNYAKPYVAKADELADSRTGADVLVCVCMCVCALDLYCYDTTAPD